MPEDIEVPTENLHETLQEKAEERGPDRDDWVQRVAVTAAILAVLAAIAALLAGHHANEGVLESIHASDRWSYYQAKAIKASVLETKVELLRELDRSPGPGDAARVDGYREEQKQIEAEAKELERSSDRHMQVHAIFARTVTLLQIAIALAAISVLSRKRWLFLSSVGLAVAGVALLLQAAF